MQKVLLNVVAGAVGGALVMVLAINSPQLAGLFDRGAVSVATDGEAEEVDAAGEGSLQTYEAAVVRAAEMANPAVVSIVVTADVPVVERFFQDIPFNPYFNFQVPQFRQRGTQKREVGGGSGFVVSPDGLIITNRHVVDQTDVEYTVLMNDGTKLDATVVARDAVNDLAVIKIEGANLAYLNFANSDDLHIGQTVIAIGNSLGEFRNTVSVGVVSGLSRSIIAGDNFGQAEQLEEVVQTDAAINPGNSGGPLLNLSGEVIGVNVAVALGSENIGFALPANLVRGVLTSVQETGKIVRPYIGVRYMTITPAVQEANNMDLETGVIIVRGETAEELAVIPGSPADKAGLKEGDVILEIDGAVLANDRSLATIIRKKSVGDIVKLKVLSQGVEKEVTLTLDELKE